MAQRGPGQALRRRACARQGYGWRWRSAEQEAQRGSGLTQGGGRGSPEWHGGLRPRVHEQAVRSLKVLSRGVTPKVTWG